MIKIDRSYSTGFMVGVFFFFFLIKKKRFGGKKKEYVG